MSASGLSCPSDTTASCYKYESSTVSSGSCSKTCTYKVANTPSCGSNAHVTGSGTSCSCECDSGYSGDPFSGCSLSCSPLANESSDSSTCKTKAYSCSDGCTGTRTCYKSACTGSEVCYNSSCCTPKWPSYQGYDYNNCMTSSDGTVSDGCGNSTTKYKSKCSSGQSCNGSGQCINDCQKTNCSGYPYGGSTPYTIYTGYGHYDTCEPGCGESTRYKCKSGYTAKLMSGTTYYCAESGGGTGGGTGGGSGDNTKVCYCYNSCCGTSTTNCIAKCGGSAIAPYCKRKDVSQNQYCW